MELRSDLLMQELRDLLNTNNVYFQPSSGAGLGGDEAYIFTGIDYPCFIVKRTSAYQPKANDKTYLFRPAYEVTYINRDEPDPEMLYEVEQRFSLCNYQRHFVADNLHHDVWVIYY
jgi:hypothetical protein